ncbi:MAG: DUF480 domain-containing protein [Bacteroidia bacterium]|nr:DUF480 domain-containing protein [Bacteroidia bacterium]
MEQTATLPILNPVEIRVLGSLIEKSKTTPDYYPMTLNSLTAACNQKSSRNPVVEYDEATVVMALNTLKGQSLVAMAVGGTSRTNKYKHNFLTVYPMTDGELAALCLLFLRGPLTPGEINSNSGRLHLFNSLESVQEVLNKLANANPPFVTELPKRPGQKEARYAHLLTELANQAEEVNAIEPARKNVSELEARLTLMERELAEVKEKLDKLMKELLG